MKDAPTNEELMARYVDGDDAAADELFDRLAPSVLRVLQRTVPDSQSALELAQQTFLQVHRSRADWDGQRLVRPWVLAIATNVRRDHHRRRVRRPEGYTAGCFELERLSGAGEQEAKVTAGEVRRAVAALPHDQRAVVEMHWLEGFSMREVGEMLGISRSAAKLRAFRAYELLRGALGDHARNHLPALDEEGG